MLFFFFFHKLTNTVAMLQGYSKVPLSGHLSSLARPRGGRKCFEFNINYESRTSDFSFHFLTPMLYVLLLMCQETFRKVSAGSSHHMDFFVCLFV